jgi:hypothetical protein
MYAMETENRRPYRAQQIWLDIRVAWVGPVNVDAGNAGRESAK